MACRLGSSKPVAATTSHHVQRGDVYRSNIYLPNRTGQGGTKELLKWCVLLQSDVGSFAQATDVAVVLASTDKSAGRALREFEVRVGWDEGFVHDSVIDCRWIYSFPKSLFHPADRVTTLDAPTMQQVNISVAKGLQLL